MVYVRRFRASHPLLGRHIRHDPRSRQFPYRTDGFKLTSAVFARHTPILDQGQLGSCTGNATAGCLGTDPFFDTLAPGVDLTETGAVSIYSQATHEDDYDGEYPPTDTGSDGLTVAKVAKERGYISGYQHTFSAQDAFLALGKTPALFGINWYDGMFSPDADGRVRIGGSLAGGHEVFSREIDVLRERVWFDNSWSPSFGVGGRFYMTFDDTASLLGEDGDVTIFVPNTKPAPIPDPVPANMDAADRALWQVAKRWVGYRHTSIAENKTMQGALKNWAKIKGA